MFIIYLSVNGEVKIECKCGIFIVNAESLLYTSAVVFGSPLLFMYCGSLLCYLQCLFPPDSLQSLKVSLEILESNRINLCVFDLHITDFNSSCPHNTF